MKKVSIIVPVYKVEPFIDRCINSILSQTYTNFELLLIDDGSPDKCGQICDEYKKRDERIKVIHQENMGLSGARNTGLKFATGEYISFIDSDDSVTKDFLEILVNTLEKNDCDLIECQRIDVYEDSYIPLKSSTYSNFIIFDKTEAFELLIKNQTIYQTVWNKLYKKSIIGDSVFPVGKLHEDEFFTWQIIAKCKKIGYTPSPLYFYFHREGSIMQFFSEKRLDSFEARLERHRYIEKHFPHLITESKISIAFPCIFTMQKLQKREFKSYRHCKKQLQHIYNQAKLQKKELITLEIKKRIWFILANISLPLCAKVRNILKRRY